MVVAVDAEVHAGHGCRRIRRREDACEVQVGRADIHVVQKYRGAFSCGIAPVPLDAHRLYIVPFEFRPQSGFFRRTRPQKIKPDRESRPGTGV